MVLPGHLLVAERSHLLASAHVVPLHCLARRVVELLHRHVAEEALPRHDGEQAEGGQRRPAQQAHQHHCRWNGPLRRPAQEQLLSAALAAGLHADVAALASMQLSMPLVQRIELWSAAVLCRKHAAVLAGSQELVAPQQVQLTGRAELRRPVRPGSKVRTDHDCSGNCRARGTSHGTREWRSYHANAGVGSQQGPAEGTRERKTYVDAQVCMLREQGHLLLEEHVLGSAEHG
mmetsp:Transcript_1172/g.4187  ORF Transcript_1172/g.4187 Transcript_1172/m.4187 type:complete len:232 (-) Transcript_1172:171-866(-)